MGKTTSNDPNVVTQEVVAANGQAVDIVQYKKYDGTVAWKVNKDGFISEPQGTAGLTASYIIFKTGSTYYAKNGATGAIDYSGTDASTVIQSVVNVLTAGGEIDFRAGIYTLMTPINLTLPDRPLVIRGAGITGTILRSGAAGVMINVAPTNWCFHALSISHLTLDGNNIGTIGLKYTTFSNKSVMDHMFVEKFTQWGIYDESDHSNEYFAVRISACGSTSASLGGAFLSSNASNMYGCTIENCGTGIFLHNCYGNLICGCVIEGNAYHGISSDYTSVPVTAVQNIHILKCEFEQNGLALAPNTFDINLDALQTSSWTIESCRFSGTSTTYSINVCGWYTTLINNRPQDTNLIYWDPTAEYGNIIGKNPLAAANPPLPIKVGVLSGGETISRTYDQIVQRSLQVQGSAIDAVTFAVQAVTGQTADIVQYKKSDGTVAFNLDKDGRAYFPLIQKNLLSADFAIDAIGIVTVTTAHGLSITPSPKDISVTIIESTAVDDWVCGYAKIVSVDAANVVCKVKVTTASATASAKAKLGLKIDVR